MNPEFKWKAKAGIGIGLGLEVAVRLLVRDENVALPVMFMAGAVGLAGALFLIWGCTNYATAKGLPHWLGYLGFFSVVGVIIIALLPSRSRA